MAQLIRPTLLADQHREHLLFMDDFGKRYEVYLDFSQAGVRADKIASTIAMLNEAERKLRDYAASAGHDLTDQLAKGAAAIKAEQEK